MAGVKTKCGGQLSLTPATQIPTHWAGLRDRDQTIRTDMIAGDSLTHQQAVATVTTTKAGAAITDPTAAKHPQGAKQKPRHVCRCNGPAHVAPLEPAQ